MHELHPDLVPMTRQTPLAGLHDIAQAVVHLRPRSAHITGQVLAVDGGWTAYGYL
jgi:NAD(P)-dependent dehydrogenase (short-subunit alcohol dehydrogenase family)